MWYCDICKRDCEGSHIVKDTVYETLTHEENRILLTVKMCEGCPWRGSKKISKGVIKSMCNRNQKVLTKSDKEMVIPNWCPL